MGESVTRFRSRYPLIYSGTWQSENKIGIALASISEHPFNVSFNFDSKDYDLPASGKIYIIDAEGKKFINSYSENKISVNYTLKPRGICIIEITN
jgi:hypothetical protein